MKNKPRVCIVILSWNCKELTKDCLDSIKKDNSFSDFKVVIVDNGSTDGAIEMIKKNYKWVDLIELGFNHGFSGANNKGILYSSKKYNPDYYYFLNNDTLVTKNWLKNIVSFADKNKFAGMFGSKQRDFNNKPAIYAGRINSFGVHEYFSPTKPALVSWIPGGSFMVKKEVISKVGAFDESFNPIYYEETDWEERARKAGFEIYSVPSSFIYHKGSGTISSYTYSHNKIFYKNRVIFYQKHYRKYLFGRALIDLIRGILKLNLKTVIGGYMQGFRELKKDGNKIKTIYI